MDEFRKFSCLGDLHCWIITKVLRKHLRIFGLLFVVGFLVQRVQRQQRFQLQRSKDDICFDIPNPLLSNSCHPFGGEKNEERLLTQLMSTQNISKQQVLNLNLTYARQLPTRASHNLQANSSTTSVTLHPKCLS